MTDYTINVKVTTRAASNKLGELFIDAGGEPVLKLYTTAVAEQGKANDAIIAFLAKTWKMPKKDIMILKGHSNSNKLIALTNPPNPVIELFTTPIT